MNNMRYRIGQLVRLIDNENMSADIGAIGKIYAIDEKFTWQGRKRTLLKVHWLTTNSNRQMHGGYFIENFKPYRYRRQLLFKFMYD